MFKYTITAVASQDVLKKNLVAMGYNESQIDDYINMYIPMKDKMRMSDYFIDVNGDIQSIERNTINVINKKLEIDFWFEIKIEKPWVIPRFLI